MSVDRVEIRARAVLEQAQEPWQGVLQRLLIEGLTTRQLATFFVGTSVERRGEFAIVRCRDGFSAEWLRRNYREQVGRALEVVPTRVIFATTDQDVQLEPEPVEDDA